MKQMTLEEAKYYCGAEKSVDRVNRTAIVEIRCYYTYILVCMYLLGVMQYLP